MSWKRSPNHLPIVSPGPASSQAMRAETHAALQQLIAGCQWRRNFSRVLVGL
jgi:hypothetical protein